MKTKKWKGSFSIRRISDSEQDEPIARSPIYEFELPIRSTAHGLLSAADIDRAWRSADVELCRRWNDQGQPLEGEPGLKAHDPFLRLYRTLGTQFDRGHGWFMRADEHVFRLGIDNQAVGTSANDELPNVDHRELCSEEISIEDLPTQPAREPIFERLPCAKGREIP